MCQRGQALLCQSVRVNDEGVPNEPKTDSIHNARTFNAVSSLAGAGWDLGGSGGHSKGSSPSASFVERTRLTASAATALGEGGAPWKCEERNLQRLWCFEVTHDSWGV